MKLNFSVFRTMMLSALLFVGVAAQARVISGTVKDHFRGRERYHYWYSDRFRR